MYQALPSTLEIRKKALARLIRPKILNSLLACTLRKPAEVCDMADLFLAQDSTKNVDLIN